MKQNTCSIRVWFLKWDNSDIHSEYLFNEPIIKKNHCKSGTSK